MTTDHFASFLAKLVTRHTRRDALALVAGWGTGMGLTGSEAKRKKRK